MATQTLLIQSSILGDYSTSRPLAKKLAEGLGGALTERDLSSGVEYVDGAWAAASNTPEAERSAEQKETLAYSDGLVAEVEAADTIVIAAPIYNFDIPAQLKSWLDQLARAKRTFFYNEDGQPVGLLTGKKVYVVRSSAGTPEGAFHDHATPYLKFMLGFLGMDDVTFISADNLAMERETALETANAKIDAAIDQAATVKAA